MKITNITTKLRYYNNEFLLSIEAKFNGIYDNTTYPIMLDQQNNIDIKITIKDWIPENRFRLLIEQIDKNRQKIIKILDRYINARALLEDISWEEL